MMIEAVKQTLIKLEHLIAQGKYEEVETDRLELKPLPANASEWQEPLRTICAFLNTRGGVLILGIKEEGRGEAKRYVFTGYKPHLESDIKKWVDQFTDREQHKLDLSATIAAPYLEVFLDGKVVILSIEALPADQKFAFYKGEAYQRLLTGDHIIKLSEIERQEEFKREAADARELQPVQGLTENDLDIDKLNAFILALNRGATIETLKTEIMAARSFLERRSFMKDGQVTLLGALVCAMHPSDVLATRCQVNGYVDGAGLIAQDKQSFADNILPLMNASFNYIWRSIQVGISAQGGGKSMPQYPEDLIRETINNALAHRDYSQNSPINVIIKPNQHISIQNPGEFRKQLLIEYVNDRVPIRRISPESKARNPKLADVLRLYNKWEGRGIGMATLVNLCLQNEIDLPYYILKRDDVTLVLQAGRLLDNRVENLLKAFDGYIERKLNGLPLTESQKRILAYLIKSEEANAISRYTIMLTPSNNHFSELRALEQAGLIDQHPDSAAYQPIYLVDRVLMKTNYFAELTQLFGEHSFDALNIDIKHVLNVIYRVDQFSKNRIVSARQIGLAILTERNDQGDYKQQDGFLRKVRKIFAFLHQNEFIKQDEKSKGYRLNMMKEKPGLMG
ncbi:MAG: putative DNA binding domain-containing protein [Anaerolineae bacterium]|nr:putative DNA binding domain-containing protein [Anaerolineae bacterium]